LRLVGVALGAIACDLSQFVEISQKILGGKCIPNLPSPKRANDEV
jgi:hypothetical protein